MSDRPLETAILESVYTGEVLTQFMQQPGSDTRLTNAELHAFTLYLLGYRYGEIAADLGLGVRSVRTYVTSAYRKLRVFARDED